MIDIKEALLQLSRKRPVFHSEADFQHSLALEIQQHTPGWFLRLEFPHSQDRKYLDILVGKKDVRICIELKYKTRDLQVPVLDETFYLRYQGAQDIGRYDFLKDIQRLEKFSDLTKGYAIFLTNDKNYWEQSRYNDTIDAEFRVHEGRILHGALSWGVEASEGTMRGRKDKIQ